MQILVPLKESKEVLPLCQEGADVFYCGLMDSQSALNDRPNTAQFNFSSLGDLQKAIDMAHQKKKKIYLTVNQLTPDGHRSLKQVELATKLKMDGVIIANFFLMEQVHRLRLPLEIHASCLTATLNSQTVQFFKKCGACHIHLPRHLGLQDVRSLIQSSLDMSFGVFVMSGMCANIEAFCSLHALSTHHNPPCLFFKPHRTSDHAPAMTDMQYKMNSPKEACALCALPSLGQMGIATLKIEGREEPLSQKRQYVHMVHQALTLLEEKVQYPDYIHQCQDIFQSHFQMPCHQQYCYF